MNLLLRSKINFSIQILYRQIIFSGIEPPEDVKPSKKRRIKTPRKAKLNKSYNELNPDERSNLADDLQYSSDEHFYDDDEEEELMEEDDWQDVEDPGFSVTVDAQPRGFYQEVCYLCEIQNSLILLP